MKRKILIVDDERIIRDMMARILSSSYVCRTAPDAEQALAVLQAEPDVALVLTDYKMPGMNGVDLIRAVKKLSPAPACLLLTAFGEISLAVEAMKAGACDFLTKPIKDMDELELKIAQAIEMDAPAPAAKVADAADDTPPAPFTGKSPAMARVYRLIRKVAPTNATVLVEGPSGTGKELVARALHDLSPRAKAPFVALECSAFAGDLLASELFGYMPGTFTGGLANGKPGCFEQANGGTIFLDEIGEIDRPTQIALLRVLESKCVRRLGSAAAETPVDFRLVAATNRDLAAMVAAGTFREDLFYRLNVIDVKMPPLAERPGDVRLLAEHFLKEFSAANGGLVRSFAPETLAALEAYSWPGNVRQLRNAIEKMVILATGPTLTKEDLPAEVSAPAEVASPAHADAAHAPRPPAGASLADTEKASILAALEQTHGNKSKAADLLGISRRTILRKLNEWNL